MLFCPKPQISCCAGERPVRLESLLGGPGRATPGRLDAPARAAPSEIGQRQRADRAGLGGVLNDTACHRVRDRQQRLDRQRSA